MNGIRQSEGLKVLEFFGVPGVGKSYLVSTAVSVDIAQPMKWYSQGTRLLRIWRKIGLLLRDLPTATKSASWARELIKLYPSMGRRRRWKVLFNWVFIDSVIRDAARGRSKLVVLDQGIAQGMWSTQFGAGGACEVEDVRALMRRYLEGLPITEWAVVHVTAPLEIVQARVEGRKGFSPIDRDIATMEEARCADRVVDDVLKSLSRMESKPRITIVDLLNDGEEALARVRDFVAQIEI